MLPPASPMHGFHAYFRYLELPQDLIRFCCLTGLVPLRAGLNMYLLISARKVSVLAAGMVTSRHASAFEELAEWEAASADLTSPSSFGQVTRRLARPELRNPRGRTRCWPPVCPGRQA